MKIKIMFPSVSLISFALCLFIVNGTAAQSNPEQTTATTTYSSGNSDVHQIAVRIAVLYGADVSVVESFVQAAVDLEDQIGISAPVVIAIAIHESSFKSQLFMNSGNPFGIKASKPWTGPTFSKWQDGEESKYRVYESAHEAVTDFGYFVGSRSWYADALACPMDQYQCEVNGLMKSNVELGYSENPGWGEAVLSIIDKIGLRSLAVR